MIQRIRTRLNKAAQSWRISMNCLGVALLCAVVITSASCTNGKGLNSKSLNTGLSGGSASGNSGSSGSNGASGSANNSASSLYITNVILDSVNPSAAVDVLANNGAFGKLCTPSSSSSASAGASTCSCVFTFVNPTTNQSEQVTTNTTYVESNLLICPTTTLPANLPEFYVEVTDSSPAITSNNYHFVLATATNGTVFNTADASSFVQVQRYTCIPKVYVQDVLDVESTIYDPVLSENPRNAYPVDLYTTNIGYTMNLYAGGAGSAINPITSYDCSTNPLNPPVTPSNAQNFRSTFYTVPFPATWPAGHPLPNPAPTPGTELLLGGPGVGAVAGGILGSSNPNAPNTRSTFFLATTKTGVFNVPVNAYGLPDQPTPVASVMPSLGYAVANIPSPVPGEESCPGPSAVPIPPGMQWVKLWQFRANLPTRIAPVSYNLQELSPIGCNPGPYPTPTTLPSGSPYLSSEVPDCYQKPYLGDGTSNLAARFAQNSSTGMAGICWTLQTNGTFDAAGQDASFNRLDEPHFNGTDVWNPSNEDPNYGCRGVATKQFPNLALESLLGLCPAAVSSPVPITDPKPTPYPIDPQGSTRYEFVFVTTPVTVMTADMTNSNNSGIGTYYTPYRFLSDTYCNEEYPSLFNPTGTSTLKCSNSNKIQGYQLSLQDVNNPTDINAPNIFPLCVLQPTGLK